MTNLFFDNLDQVSWENIPWEDIQLYIFKIQAQIYTTASKKKYGSTRRLQEFIIKDYNARLLSLYTVSNYEFIKKKLV